ncbi:succinate dehydrogenase, hydrophobic membrane anchor protein [Govanella unica]|uniref:Succinate dehydrogenase hydrophobic membrane anchor subunit n=1 Tax=Govanella unica TaxID=2975056 RepID=A0A9X3Z641_9PROT|nr:succinate dehydrogenase, hydrophobic membrane anchor protein [Govania unica]MDA5192736.1 succinate dehydrogenase, hydrophobic membrane anchor protein [Govania unica]
MSLRTALGRVRGLGSAKDGTHHWWMQRVTAVALIPLTVWIVASLVALVGADYETVRTWMAMPLVAILFILFLATGLYHLRLGIQVVIEDYVHSEGVKIVSMMALTFACVLVAAASIFAVLKIAFQG